MKQQSYTQIFQRDPNYYGPHIVQTYLKKEKSFASYRLLGSTNTRFFTLNMQNFQFYYTPKDQYQSKDIKYIDIENLKYVVDRGCKKNSKGQSQEWTYQFIMYFTNKYTVIYCQNEQMKQIWLNAFKNIIKTSDKKRLFYGADFIEDNSKNQQNNNNSHNQTQEINSEKIMNSNSNTNTNNIQNSSNSQIEQKKAKNNLDSQEQINNQNDSRRNSHDSFQSNDSQGRKKRKSQFQEIKKRAVCSDYKRKQNFDQFWNNKVIPLLRYKLQQVRNKFKRIKENEQSQKLNQENFLSKQQGNELQENKNQKSDKQIQPAKQKQEPEEDIFKENNKFIFNNEVEVLNLEASNITGHSYDDKLSSEVKIFRKSDEKNSQKKSHKNSLQKSEGSGRKHKANIFENVYKNGDYEDETPTLNIQFQNKKSQNGWDGNDLDILQNILRENSVELKENINDNFQENKIKAQDQKQQEYQFNKIQVKNEVIQEVNIFHQENQQKINQSSKKMAIDDYDDWDVDLDNTPTPAIGNKKSNLQQQYQQHDNNTNISSVYSNKNQINNFHSMNQCFTSNNKGSSNQENCQQPFQKSQVQQKQQLPVVDNDYDNWDEDM
ncbi:hypothetical protein ABPG72_011724 [Tetrahymena utriculariae]